MWATLVDHFETPFVLALLGALIGFAFGYFGFTTPLANVLMGFGGILAGGCAVGAGVTGASLFSLTSWLTLLAMWVGGIVNHRLVDHGH
jgi:ABC-type uncharacterized transport system permease subunit